MGSSPECISPVVQVENGVDVHTHTLMKYENGAIASVSCSFELDKLRSAYIYGTKGYIRIPCFYGATELYLHIDGEEKHIVLPSIGDGFEEEIYEVCNCILAGKTESDTHPMSASIEVLKQCDVIRRQIGIRYSLEGEEF